MNEIIKNIEAEQLKADVPQFNVGDTVRVHALIKEGNRERIQVFEGTVLKKQGGSNQSYFHSKKELPTVLALRKHGRFIPHTLKKVEVIRRGKVTSCETELLKRPCR